MRRPKSRHEIAVLGMFGGMGTMIGGNGWEHGGSGLHAKGIKVRMSYCNGNVTKR